MSILKFIQNLLKIKGYRVTGFTFHNWHKELWLEVKPYKNGARCPLCNQRGKIIRTFAQPPIWHDVPVCGRRVFLVYRPREITCRKHGRIQERIPCPLCQGSWLKVAEIERSVLKRHFLAGRIDYIDKMRKKVTAWNSNRNNRQPKVDWQYKTDDARIKLQRLYPSI